MTSPWHVSKFMQIVVWHFLDMYPNSCNYRMTFPWHVSVQASTVLFVVVNWHWTFDEDYTANVRFEPQCHAECALFQIYFLVPPVHFVKKLTSRKVTVVLAIAVLNILKMVIFFLNMRVSRLSKHNGNGIFASGSIPVSGKLLTHPSQG